MDNIILTPINVDEFAKKVAQHLHDIQKAEVAAQPVPSEAEEEYLTSKQVLEILKISSTTLWKWKNKGRIKEYGTGGKRYFKRSEIDQALERTN